MEEFLDDEEFVQFILDHYLPTPDVNNKEKLQKVFSSSDNFNLAMESFLKKAGIIGMQ